MRTGHYTNQLMIILVTNGKAFKQAESLVDALVRKYPNVTSIKQNINDAHSNVIMGPQSITLYGEEEIEDQLMKSLSI